MSDKLKVHDSHGRVVGEIDKSGDDAKDYIAAHKLLTDLGLFKGEDPLPERIYKNAMRFGKVAVELWNKISRLGPQGAGYVAPFSMIAAFALELHIKALGAKHGKTLRGHELAKLFDALPTSALDAIGRHAVRMKAKHEIEHGVDFRDCLVRLNDAFVTWRYSFEFDANPVMFYPGQAIFQTR